MNKTYLKRNFENIKNYKKFLKILKYIKFKRAVIFRSLLLLIFLFFTLEYLGIPDKYDRAIYYTIYIIFSINFFYYLYLWYHDFKHKRKVEKIIPVINNVENIINDQDDIKGINNSVEDLKNIK